MSSPTKIVENAISDQNLEGKKDADKVAAILKPGELYAKWQALSKEIELYENGLAHKTEVCKSTMEEKFRKISNLQKELIGLVMNPQEKPKTDADKPDAALAETNLRDTFCEIQIRKIVQPSLSFPKYFAFDQNLFPDCVLGPIEYWKITSDTESEFQYFLRIFKETDRTARKKLLKEFVSYKVTPHTPTDSRLDVGLDLDLDLGLGFFPSYSRISRSTSSSSFYDAYKMPDYRLDLEALRGVTNLKMGDLQRVIDEVMKYSLKEKAKQ